MSEDLHKKLQKHFAEMMRLKRAHQLHPAVEKRLTLLLKELYPNDHIVSEIGGILGGRNDLMQFSSSGKKIVFELFASPSQVPQDLRLLEQSIAEVRVAILLDPEVNQKLSDEYFRKKPDPFPFIWVKEVMVEEWRHICQARLRELIDDESVVRILRRVLSYPNGTIYGEQIKKNLINFENRLRAKSTSKTGDKPIRVTNLDCIAVDILMAMEKIGIPRDRLRSLFQWLTKIIPHAIEIRACNLSAYLSTDLNEHRAVWSDMDLKDELLICKAGFKPRVIFCLDQLIDMWRERLLKSEIPSRIAPG